MRLEFLKTRMKRWPEHICRGRWRSSCMRMKVSPERICLSISTLRHSSAQFVPRRGTMRFVDTRTITNDGFTTRNFINFVHPFFPPATGINRSAGLFDKDIYFSWRSERGMKDQLWSVIRCSSSGIYRIQKEEVEWFEQKEKIRAIRKRKEIDRENTGRKKSTRYIFSTGERWKTRLLRLPSDAWNVFKMRQQWHWHDERRLKAIESAYTEDSRESERRGAGALCRVALLNVSPSLPKRVLCSRGRNTSEASFSVEGLRKCGVPQARLH